MKDQSFIVFRTLTLAVCTTVLFSHYWFSVCCHEELNLWWVYAAFYQKVLRLWEKYMIIHLKKGFVKHEIALKMQITICLFPYQKQISSPWIK